MEGLGLDSDETMSDSIISPQPKQRKPRTATSRLIDLARLYGIERGYYDLWGKRAHAPEATLRHLLRQAGVACTTDEEVCQSLWEGVHAPWLETIAPVLVRSFSEQPLQIPLSLRVADQDNFLVWELQSEEGSSLQGVVKLSDLAVQRERRISGDLFRRYLLPLAALPDLGYYSLTVQHSGKRGGRVAQSTIIITPERCYLPEALQGAGRTWGLSTQLYSIRSQTNWGIGDFADLEQVIELCARVGGSVVGLNPLHALPLSNPLHFSPYSPVSRLALNVSYISIPQVPEFGSSLDAQQLAQSFAEQIERARQTELVDYAAVRQVKFPVLEKLYQHFRLQHLATADERGQAFLDFCAQRGAELETYATFEALDEFFTARRKEQGVYDGSWGWTSWPAAYASPTMPAVTEFQERNRERVDFFKYLQWEADRQLSRVCAKTGEAGLDLGLYLDLALGADRASADVWADQSLFALETTVGCPPDECNLTGQNWGFPPVIPAVLRQRAYQPFVKTLRASMRYAQALRLDHVMGLMRLFWVPRYTTPVDGTYVQYPVGDMMRIVALESVRQRCLVIGEDLGTVPPRIRELMATHGVFSYKLLLFMKERAGEFQTPEQYPAEALVTASTHDLPTLSGYWDGADLEIRKGYQLYPRQGMYEQNKVERGYDRGGLLWQLHLAGLLPSGVSLENGADKPMSFALICALYSFLAQTPAKLLLVQLEDLLEQREQVNVPGLTTEYPCWRRKLSCATSDLESDPRVQRLGRVMRDSGR